MAVELEQLNKDPTFKLKLDNLKAGRLFCFLPLSIQTNLNYHLNGAFALTEDRQALYKKTNDDKDHLNKSKWNDYLIQPLVDNLISVIQHASKNINIENF